MFLNEFYKLNALEKLNDDRLNVNITLNKHHEIFKAHFPGNPVTPGVCMMQIIKEILEKHFGQKMILLKANDIKFTALINPFENEELNLKIELQRIEDLIKAKVQVFFADVLALKMVGLYNKL